MMTTILALTSQHWAGMETTKHATRILISPASISSILTQYLLLLFSATFT